jgi:hypothetical protein
MLPNMVGERLQAPVQDVPTRIPRLSQSPSAYGILHLGTSA